MQRHGVAGTYFRRKERLICFYYTIATAEKQGDQACRDVSGGAGQKDLINEHIPLKERCRL